MNLIQTSKPNRKKGFTLIELLVVVAILGVLAAAVTVILNPVELLAQSRDATRVSDMGTISKAIALVQVYNVPFCANPNVVYVSVPDASSTTCGDLSLPAAPNGYTYSCVTPSNLKNINGTGWIPINFASSTTGTPLPNLPIDPTNSVSAGLYYIYACSGSSYQISSTPESAKYKSQPTIFAQGSNPSLVSLSGGSVTHGSSTIAYSGSVQSWTVPSGITSITVTAYGSAGNAGAGTNAGAGGNGAIVSGKLSVTPGATYYIGFISGGASGSSDRGVGTLGGPGGYASWFGIYNTFSAVSNLPLLVAAGGGGGSGAGTSGYYPAGGGGGAGFGGGGGGGAGSTYNGGAGGSLGNGTGGNGGNGNASAGLPGTGGAGGGGGGGANAAYQYGAAGGSNGGGGGGGEIGSSGTWTGTGSNGNGSSANGSGGNGSGTSEGIGGTGSNSGTNLAGGGGGGVSGTGTGTGGGGGGGGAGSDYFGAGWSSISESYSNTISGTGGAYIYITY